MARVVHGSRVLDALVQAGVAREDACRVRVFAEVGKAVVVRSEYGLGYEDATLPLTGHEFGQAFIDAGLIPPHTTKSFELTIEPLGLATIDTRSILDEDQLAFLPAALAGKTT